MHETIINELIDLFNGNQPAIELIIKFFTNNRFNIDNQTIISDVTQLLSEITPDGDMKIALECSVIDHVLSNIKRQQDFIDFASSSAPRAEFLPSFSNNRSASSSATEELIMKLATSIQCFRESELQQPLCKPYKCDDGVLGMMEVSHNAAMFKIPSQGGNCLELDECWCDEGLSRNNRDNIRTRMEDNIIQTITHTITDKNKKIRLVNIGSDRVGLIIILAKLSLNGYKNIDIQNVELLSMKNYVEHPTKDQEYLKFLKATFGNSCSYKMIFSDNNQDAFNSDVINLPEATTTIVFAEDLGGVDKDDYQYKYKKIISNVMQKLDESPLHNKTGNIFISEHTGELLPYELMGIGRRLYY